MTKTITFFLNGKKYYSNKVINIENMLKYFQYKPSLLIIEHNHFICKKKNWSKDIINNNDKIEIISIVGGG